jgi:membrane-associated phospholipid phosphatase
MYAYLLWRPATAIRNGDVDGNDDTARDASWSSLIPEPMHPEYPSAHATLAGAVGAVLKAEIGAGAVPILATASPTAKGATRRWTSIDEFVREVSESRVYAGIHYRFSTDAGIALGTSIGELTARRVLQPGENVARNAY